MPGAFVDEQARTALRDAVRAVEAVSAAEVVIAVRRQSHSYLHANLVVGGGVLALALAYMVLGANAFSPLATLVDPLVAGLLAGLAVEWVAPLKRVLTSARARRRAVERAARATFVERGVHTTFGRTGVLVYASWLERQAAMVVDIAVDAALAPSVRQAAVARLNAAMQRDGAALAAAVAALAGDLAQALPRAADDRNELSDELDAHTGRRARSTSAHPVVRTP